MTAPCTADAAYRAVVRLSDGRTGRLLYWPGKRPKAKVILQCGSVVNIDPAHVTLDDDEVTA